VKLLFMIDSLAPGGAERSLVELLPLLAAGGVSPEIAVLHDRPGLAAEALALGVPVTHLAPGGERLAGLRQARRLLRARRPDLVHTTLFEADLVGRTAAFSTLTPVVSSLVNVAYGPEQLEDPGLRRSRVRGAHVADAATARAVRRFHAISDYVAQTMAARLRIPAQRIETIPRFRDPRKLGTRSPARSHGARSALAVEADAPLVLTVARQEYQKGLDVLLRAVPATRARVAGLQVVIAGRHGKATPHLRGLVERLGLGETVRFLGVRSDVDDLLSAANAFVLPSRWEGLGGALLEAMALEAPVVAADLPPVREVLGSPPPALLVPPEDDSALANAIVETIEQGEAARARAEAARARFLESYSTEVVAGEMLAFYERALA
jgi:glycosyltransferase involved in cell wall biosynthesis